MTADRPRRRLLYEFVLPALFLIAVMAFCTLAGFDLALARRFYEPGLGWIHEHRQPWEFVYRYGHVPAIVLSGAAFGLLVASLAVRRLRPYRRAARYLVLLVLLGPVLLVNVTLKEFWGRPRPKEVQTFGGPAAYRPVWPPHPGGSGRSFPSGHAAAGFYLLLGPYFVWRRRRSKRARLCLALGLGYGLFVGLARIVQGAHFITDVIGSAGVLYFAAAALDWLLERLYAHFGQATRPLAR